MVFFPATTSRSTLQTSTLSTMPYTVFIFYNVLPWIVHIRCCCWYWCCVIVIKTTLNLCSTHNLSVFIDFSSNIYVILLINRACPYDTHTHPVFSYRMSLPSLTTILHQCGHTQFSDIFCLHDLTNTYLKCIIATTFCSTSKHHNLTLLIYHPDNLVNGHVSNKSNG